MCVCVCVCVSVFTQPLHMGKMWFKVNFQAVFNRLEFRIFFLVNRLPYQNMF